MSYKFLTRVSLDVGYALFQSIFFMVTFLQSLRLCLLRSLSLIFSDTCKNLIDPLLSTTGNISMEEEHLSDRAKCYKAAPKSKETPATIRCFGSPLQEFGTTVVSPSPVSGNLKKR